MLDRQHGDIIFECDSCGDVLETNQADFSAAWNMAKRGGWRTQKVGKDWVHSCDKCNQKEQ